MSHKVGLATAFTELDSISSRYPQLLKDVCRLLFIYLELSYELFILFQYGVASKDRHDRLSDIVICKAVAVLRFWFDACVLLSYSI